MERYSLHNEHGHRIGKADTAQGIGDIAKPGTWSYDTDCSTAFPCVVYSQDLMGVVGTSYKYRFDAMKACTKIVNTGKWV